MVAKLQFCELSKQIHFLKTMMIRLDLNKPVKAGEFCCSANFSCISLVN